MGREKPERKEKEEEERSGRKVGSGLNAGSSASVTLAPSPLQVIDRAQELGARDAGA